VSQALHLTLDDGAQARLVALATEHGIKRAALVSAAAQLVLAADDTTALVVLARAITGQRQAHGEQERVKEATTPPRRRYSVVLDPRAETELKDICTT
jgi:hypothetical protein